MKKILSLFIGLLLFVIVILSAIKGLYFGKFQILSINGLKAKSLELDKKIEEANSEIDQKYASSIQNLKTAEKRLEKAKQEYETKIETLNSDAELGITQIEKYKIEYLWGIIGNYAKKDNLRVDLDIEETSIADTYKINFSLVGSYVGITNFLYNIENDDELNYKISNFKMNPTTSTSVSKSGTETTTVSTDTLNATFTVDNIVINFN